ncbi:hypothetical protein LDENG_00191970 [Lucifuga dentata]|nr:hypothetical protein LDENG_00191970 [Lucifuga dentata]
MESRPSRGRGGSWKRGGGGGKDSESSGGEHWGRGRGGHHRGRSKRDQHHRGRGRRGGAYSDFQHRDQEEGNTLEQEDDEMQFFSRRKLESNWDRYEASEREEPTDDIPTQRGTDYHVLLESAGDSFTQFRFSEEKDWDMDSFTFSLFSAVFVDVPALAQNLQQVPLHQRLNLEAELVQVSAPAELPAMTRTPKQEMVKMPVFTPPPAAVRGLDAHQGASNPVSGSGAGISCSAAAADDDDEELDQLLGLQKPVSAISGNQCANAADEGSTVPEKKVEEVLSEVMQKMEVKDEEGEALPVRQEVTEEDLEDWLDSMIS